MQRIPQRSQIPPHPSAPAAETADTAADTRSNTDATLRPQDILQYMGLSPEQAVRLAEIIEKQPKDFADVPVLLDVETRMKKLLAANQPEDGNLSGGIASTSGDILTQDQLLAVQHAMKALPPAPLRPSSRAFVRILNESNTITGELEKLEIVGSKPLSPMTLVGQAAPFGVYDKSAWEGRSGLIFDKTTTFHVGAHKHDFRSAHLETYFRDPQAKALYDAAFDYDPPNLNALASLVQTAVQPQLHKMLQSDLVKQEAKYAEMMLRMTGTIKDISTKHRLVDFLIQDCQFDKQRVQAFGAYQEQFAAAFATLPESEKQLLQPALDKLAQMTSEEQIRYRQRGAINPNSLKYRFLHALENNALGHNEHLCLPRVRDISGIYVDHSATGLAHALEIQRALGSKQLPAHQQRVYTYSPAQDFNLIAPEEVASLQALYSEPDRRGQLSVRVAEHDRLYNSPAQRQRLFFLLIER